MEERRPKPGERYRHFKNKLYQVITVARHSETGEELVIYQALYGDFGVYARPLSMFVSPVNQEEYPQAVQYYRFERIEECGQSMAEEAGRRFEKADAAENGAFDGKVQTVQEKGINPLFISFLDTDTYSEKILLLEDNKSKLDHKLVDDMALSLDIEIRDGELENRVEELISCLRTMARFESSRLR